MPAKALYSPSDAIPASKKDVLENREAVLLSLTRTFVENTSLFFFGGLKNILKRALSFTPYLEIYMDLQKDEVIGDKERKGLGQWDGILVPIY